MTTRQPNDGPKTPRDVTGKVQVGKVRMGIVGAGGRGASFRTAINLLEDVQVTALCDPNEPQLAKCGEEFGVDEEAQFTDYETMIEAGIVNAVVLATPMPLHVPQAVAALRRDIAVLSEVPAGVSIEECRELVEAVEASKATYMMAENYPYTRPNQIVGEMVRRGEFGEVYYAEGEYIHELKDLLVKTPWRREWAAGINGVTYGTHSLGPILQWFAGQRVTKVCGVGSGNRHGDADGELFENEATCLMLCRTSNDGLIKIRVDMISDRPHATRNYQLQGMDGVYESARAPGEANRVCLRSRDPKMQTWTPLKDLADEFMPEAWNQQADAANQAGHGGGDFFVMLDFVNAVRGVAPPPIGIHEAMDMTLPGLVSQQSIRENGQWMDVPDSRNW